MDEPHIIDVRGFKCPLPVLKTERRMQALPPGAAVTVLATDPLAAVDIPNFCREKGHSLLRQEKTDDGLKFFLKKAG